MKKGQIFEGIIERVDFPNKGLVKVQEEGKGVTVCDCKKRNTGTKSKIYYKQI